MFESDDYYDLLNSYGNTTTMTQPSTEVETDTSNYSSQMSYNPYNQASYDDDDYSMTQNYSEEQSYASPSRSEIDEEEQVRVVRQMNVPTIKKEEPAVNLIKKRQRIHLQARMKIALTVFSVMVLSLIFAIIWNFASIGKMKASFAGKEVEISQLQSSISGLKSEYTSLDNGETLKQKAEEAGFVESDSSNTVDVVLDELYSEKVVDELPSNWFNDVCDFLSNLFA